MSVLSKPQILKHKEQGNIIIEPYNEKNLSNASYDVRLGKYYYRQKVLTTRSQVLNPFHEESAKELYAKVEEALPVEKFKSQINQYHNLNSDELIILISPGETILAHTIEFIGGKNGTKDLPAVTTEMRARSSMGRIGITVCKCAGWGDIGYVNRWTMEITNVSAETIPLPVGMRIAQIIFHETIPVEQIDLYQDKGGKYQTQKELEDLKKHWKPEDMLPKLYKDKDLGTFSSYNNH
ncbi:dCTP deaminase [candidate division WWE3 bacterium]|uniref:dCTP deaminase n=1 Tax=candidate division WWE3 bacterium TaxID=2053526 RepID=A0A955EE88_UNCKA|nr:dCTP deaminase [candidate division WWE3 bacterium]